jgi:protein involved in temperature-dependent protein secretion
MAIKPTDLEKILQDKFGFNLDATHKTHRWFVLRLEGLPVITTMVSHSRAEIRDNLESKISKQLKVKAQYFRGMVNCTKSREDYYLQVHQAPYPPWESCN